MNVTLQNETIVYLGKRNEDSHWGITQFPKLYAMKNGNIGMYVHDEDDAPHVLGQGMWLVSVDKGATWHFATENERSQMGTLLPNGDMLRVKNIPTKKVTGLKQKSWFGNYRIPSENAFPQKSENPDELPFPLTTQTDVFGSNDFVYLLDTLPDGLAEKRFCFIRQKDGDPDAYVEYAPVEWNYRTARIYNPSVVYGGESALFLHNTGLYEGAATIKVAPDGSLYTAHYATCPIHPDTGKYELFSAAFIFRSVDNGKTWKLQGHIPYQPDVNKDEFAYLNGGFYEPDLEWTADGSMLCILRTCNVFQGAPEWGATYLTRSVDCGKTWDTPTYFKDRGALPLLLRLSCGVMLAVITRPGIFVYASEDDGKTWTDCIEIMTDKDRSPLANVPPTRPNFHQWTGSCCNTSIYPLSENTALLAFSDFYTPDVCENGVKKKAIKTVKIVVNR